MGHNNQTNGVFDIEKESTIVADIVVDALMYPGFINDQDSDKASEIATKKFLAFRTGLNHSDSETDIQEESDNLAKIIVSALVSAGIIKETNYLRAFEIAAEEILVRRSMESL